MKITTSTKSIFEDPVIQERFYKMLKDNTAGFITSVIQIVNNNKLLQQAERDSLLFAAANAASMNLPINPNLGFAYIVPYKIYDKNTKTSSIQAQFQMGYKGFIQLAMRSGQFKTIDAKPVYEGQLIEDDSFSGMKFDWKAKVSEKIVGYAGYFKLVNGFEKTLYMTMKELKKHGLKYSQSFKKGYGLWEDEFDAMATKTVLKLLLSKFAPMSLEMQKAVISDQSILKDWEGNQLDYSDNKRLSLSESNGMKELERVHKWIDDAEDIKQLSEVNTYVYASGNEELIASYEGKAAELDELPEV